MSWAPKSPTPPPGYHYGPAYRITWDNRLRGALYILRGTPRSLGHDALYAMASMPAPPIVRGEDHIPESGPLVVLANHYERPGLWMAWPALFLSHLVRERTGGDVQWVAIETWESFSLWGIPIPPPVIGAAFARAFSTYGILAMPPPEAAPVARANAMRTAVRGIKQRRILGLMPEGIVGTTPELLPAREGSGAFLLLLAGAGAPMLPIGLYEEEDRLVANIGAPFELSVPPEVGKEARDGWARERVMLRIRDLLPESLWGVYGAKE